MKRCVSRMIRNSRKPCFSCAGEVSFRFHAMSGARQALGLNDIQTADSNDGGDMGRCRSPHLWEQGDPTGNDRDQENKKGPKPRILGQCPASSEPNDPMRSCGTNGRHEKLRSDEAHPSKVDRLQR